MRALLKRLNAVERVVSPKLSTLYLVIDGVTVSECEINASGLPDEIEIT